MIESYRIVDLFGKTHQVGKINYSNDKIDISNLSNATYIIELSDGMNVYGKVLIIE